MSKQNGGYQASARGVRLAVLNSRIRTIASKMQNTLFRTARSGVINTGRDFSCCILPADARLLAVGESLPIHVMVGADMMARSMNEFHPELKRGDAFLHNSPYHGCSHAADLSVLVPLVDAEGCIGSPCWQRLTRPISVIQSQPLITPPRVMFTRRAR